MWIKVQRFTVTQKGAFARGESLTIQGGTLDEELFNIRP